MASPAWWCLGGKANSIARSCTPISTNRSIRPIWRPRSPRTDDQSRPLKNRPVLPGGFFLGLTLASLLAVTEPPRPPPGLARRGLGCGGRGRLHGRGGRDRLGRAVADGWCCFRLRAGQEGNLLAH